MPEDTLNGFLPSVGNLEVYQLPEGEGVRVDNGYAQGMDVPIYYDPMLAKLITYGATREEAIQRMEQAIADYKVEGVQTTLPFGAFVMQHEAFRSGDFDTNFVKKYYNPEDFKRANSERSIDCSKIGVATVFTGPKVLRLPN